MQGMIEGVYPCCDERTGPAFIHPQDDPAVLLKGLIRYGSPSPIMHPICLIPTLHPYLAMTRGAARRGFLHVDGLLQDTG